MICEQVIASLGFSCKPLSEQVARIYSPFTYGDDGEVVALYVEKSPAGYLVTDDAAALMHASAMGVSLKKSRLEQVRSMLGRGVTLNDDGSISASASESDLGDAVVSVLNASVAVGNLERVWLPREVEERFIAKVEKVLVDNLGRNNVSRKVSVVGASGHEIKIPLGVSTANGLAYIQPIAAREDAVNWNSVYQGVGRMIDLKNAGADSSSRFVVLEDVSDRAESSKAENVLAIAASVILYSYLETWSRKLPLPARQ